MGFENVEIFLFDDPLDTGWLHAKGILVDDTYVNFGSTNMDALSLFQNYEQNIESYDPKVVLQVQDSGFRIQDSGECY